MPFGEALANGGGAITNDGNPLAFAGQYLDPTTGLYDMRARNYDSSTGRFQSSDPLGAIDSPEASQYGYARNDPTSFVDPSGMGAIGNTDDSIEAYCFHSLWSTGLCAGIGVTGTIAIVGGVSLAGETLLGAGEGGDEAPLIKPGSSGGPSAGNAFPQSVRQGALDENPDTCVYCHMKTDEPQVDHAISRANGGDATPDNARTTCAWCNASKGPRDFPVNPPPDYRGHWPPDWWLK